MKNSILSFLIIFSFLSTTAQERNINKLDLIQGIWENVRSMEGESSYKIIRGTNSIGISHTDNLNNLDFYLLECIEGFQRFKYEDVDSINVNSVLDSRGEYFTTILNKKYIKNGWIKKEYCIIPEYFECDGENMSINGGQLVEFVKINKLPVITLKLLFSRGKQDKRDYIKDYLGIKVVEITQPTSTVYSEPDKPTSTQLNKGDVITVLEEKGGWLKVDYGADNLGWVKKENTR